MSEPTPIETKPTPEATELETLRRVNGELINKSQTRKTKITELESQIAELQGKLSESLTTIHELTVAAPLQAMASTISTDPDFFLDQFSKSYKVELIEGKLALQTTDGKSVTTKDGVPVPFEQKALLDLLTEGESTQAKVYKNILIASRASGASGSSGYAGSERTPTKKPKPSFGIGIR